MTGVVTLCSGAAILRGFALARADELLAEVRCIARQAPFRHYVTPGNRTMSVAMTNCGPLGWVSDRSGYRYAGCDPATGRQWPPLPVAFSAVAHDAAAAIGFEGFEPDACLVNRYAPGTRLSLHQDRDEKDYNHPIVSVSLGLPARFLFGGGTRQVRPQRVLIEHGDVVVFGGDARLFHHGVAPLPAGDHPATGPFRINLTLRRAS